MFIREVITIKSDIRDNNSFLLFVVVVVNTGVIDHGDFSIVQ